MEIMLALGEEIHFHCSQKAKEPKEPNEPNEPKEPKEPNEPKGTQRNPKE